MPPAESRTMRCERCTHENAAGAARCTACGAPLGGTPRAGIGTHEPDAPGDPQTLGDAGAPGSPSAPGDADASSDTQARDNVGRRSDPEEAGDPAEPGGGEAPGGRQAPAGPAAAQHGAPPRRPDHGGPSYDEGALLHDLATRLRTRRARMGEEVRYAGFFLRFVAFMIDSLVLAFFTLPLALAGFVGVRLGLALIGRHAPVDTEETLTSLVELGWLVMAGVYFTALHRSGGQTIGKAVVGLRVRSVTLRPIGRAQSLVRTIGYVASSAFLGLGFLTVALSPRKRGWHDYLAGTCVVQTRPDLAHEEG